jgi:hypothetical protein
MRPSVKVEVCFALIFFATSSQVKSAPSVATITLSSNLKPKIEIIYIQKVFDCAIQNM